MKLWEKIYISCMFLPISIWPPKIDLCCLLTRLFIIPCIIKCNEQVTPWYIQNKLQLISSVENGKLLGFTKWDVIYIQILPISISCYMYHGMFDLYWMTALIKVIYSYDYSPLHQNIDILPVSLIAVAMSVIFRQWFKLYLCYPCLKCQGLQFIYHVKFTSEWGSWIE